MPPWWTLEDLEDRMADYNVKEILDDLNIGDVKTGPLERLQRDSDSFVGAALQDVYPEYPWDGKPVPNEVVRLSLDAAEMFLAKRAPSVLKHSWVVLKEQVDKDLDRVRTAKRSLAKRPPDPAANHGGAVYPTPSPSANTNVPIFYGGGGRWGMF